MRVFGDLLGGCLLRCRGPAPGSQIDLSNARNDENGLIHTSISYRGWIILLHWDLSRHIFTLSPARVHARAWLGGCVDAQHQRLLYRSHRKHRSSKQSKCTEKKQKSRRAGGP